MSATLQGMSATHRLNQTNPDHKYLLDLFSSKGWDTHTFLPQADPELTARGIYLKYNFTQLSRLFRVWRTSRTISQGASNGTTLTNTLESIIPSAADLRLISLTKEAYFHDASQHDPKLWPKVLFFVQQIEREMCLPLLGSIRKSLIAIVALRAASTSAHLTRKCSGYFTDTDSLRKTLGKDFLTLLFPASSLPPPPPASSSSSLTKTQAMALFFTFFRAVESAMAQAVASTGLPELGELLIAEDTDLDARRSKRSPTSLSDIGYVAGWLLSALVKRGLAARASNKLRKSWSSVATVNTLSATAATDYSAKILRVSSGKLLVPGPFFFRFVLALELFYVKALAPQNIIAYGNAVFVAAQKVLLKSEFYCGLAIQILSKVPEEGVPVEPPTNDEITEFLEWATHAYVRMRGKDFVRRLLGRKTKKRAGIAVIPFRAGIAVGAKAYVAALEAEMGEMEEFTSSVDVGVVSPGEESGDEHYASCYESDDEGGE